MKVIAFVGMPGAGKSEASGVAREMGLPVIIMGDVLREEVKNRGLTPTDKNIGTVANQLRKEEGMDAIARRCIPKIKALGRRVVVIDGIRGIAEVETFKEAFGENFTLIKIDAPFDLRLDRLRRRARSDDMGSPEWLKHRDDRELSWGMGKAIEVADKAVINLDPIDNFKAEVRSILRRESIQTTISALLFPTEIEERVRKAIGNIFPGANMKLIIKEGYVDRLEGNAPSLDHLHDLLRRQKILDTARKSMYEGKKDGRIEVQFNKQAALMGYVNFLDHEVALGGIDVDIETDEPELIIDWLAPRTQDGRPIEEITL
ncbi:MAG TPA: AAA family ATPase [Methanocella sp.]|nr:AAA family ATPase [Methanocella sp.]